MLRPCGQRVFGSDLVRRTRRWVFMLRRILNRGSCLRPEAPPIRRLILWMLSCWVLAPMAREISPREPAVVTVGVFRAGNKRNVIGEEARLELTGPVGLGKNENPVARSD